MPGARFFKSPADFRAWMEKHHADAAELLVGFHKRDSAKASITWPESVDVALCFGWIDGVRKRIDDVSYTIRFTPRKLSSTWSAVNVKRIGELAEMGLVTDAGRQVFERRRDAKTAIYAYEQDGAARFDAADEQRFRANKKAWLYFESRAPWLKRREVWKIVSAKQLKTKNRRLNLLIAACEAGKL